MLGGYNKNKLCEMQPKFCGESPVFPNITRRMFTNIVKRGVGNTCNKIAITLVLQQTPPIVLT